ncbi:hypothetical protein ACWIGI_33870 [Nocardia sp. NPDC055321]
MNHPDPNARPTYAEALERARGMVQDPGTLVHYPHPGLENATHGTGFAFLHTIRSDRGELDGYVLIATTARASGLLSAANRTIESVIDEHLRRATHMNRYIPDNELGPAQRAAIAAYDGGFDRVDQPPAHEPLDPATADYAAYVLIALRRGGGSDLTARNILARNDSLLNPPEPNRRYTHPCPHCTAPTPYSERYPRALCDHCYQRITDSTGRRITGYNTSLSGGMIAYYSDTLHGEKDADYEECVETTRTGRCYIDGRPATMREARFGGIVVQLVQSD